jgi:hypothetical protein
MKKRGVCTHLEIEPDKAGRLIMRADQAYRCKAPAPEMPVLPACITQAYGFKWPPPRGYVFKETCAECPCWSPLKE